MRLRELRRQRAAALGCGGACPGKPIARILRSNKTRQGYARKRILKPAGYFFVRPVLFKAVTWQP